MYTICWLSFGEHERLFQKNTVTSQEGQEVIINYPNCFKFHFLIQYIHCPKGETSDCNNMTNRYKQKYTAVSLLEMKLSESDTSNCCIPCCCPCAEKDDIGPLLHFFHCTSQIKILLLFLFILTFSQLTLTVSQFAIHYPNNKNRAFQHEAELVFLMDEDSRTNKESTIKKKSKYFDTTNSTSSAIEKHRETHASFPPLIIVTEGGCSGSTAVGSYLRALFLAHDLDYMRNVHFEFLHTDAHPRKPNQWKNPFYHKIYQNMKALNLNISKDEIMVKAVHEAYEISRKKQKSMIFKANIKQFQTFHKKFNDLNPTYYGVFRKDVLARCICMIKDCFYHVINDGYPVFASNKSQTDLCFQRRFRPEVKLQVVLTDAMHCMNVTRKAHAVMKKKSFPSVSEEELFLFEYSDNHEDLKKSAHAWENILKMHLQNIAGVNVSTRKIMNVLSLHQNSRQQTNTDYRNAIHNYDEVENDIKLHMGIVDS